MSDETYVFEMLSNMKPKFICVIKVTFRSAQM